MRNYFYSQPVLECYVPLNQRRAIFDRNHHQDIITEIDFDSQGLAGRAVEKFSDVDADAAGVS